MTVSSLSGITTRQWYFFLFIVFFLKIFGGHMSFYGATDTPVLDFWWRLFNGSKPEWATLFTLGGGIPLTRSLRFTSGATPADFLSPFILLFHSDVSVCVNYESDGSGNGTSGNDTTLGIFVCPLLEEEPRSYTQCCGDQYAEYCCERKDEWVVSIFFSF